jgi:hypothetical protein
VSKSYSVAQIMTRPRARLSLALKPVRQILDRMPSRAVRIMMDGGIRVHVLGAGERYGEVAKPLRRLGVDVDAWPSPPAGLFIIEERTAYFRLMSSMTIAHELGHALDCALGGGVYRSGYDAEIRSAFSEATSFVTPYAAVGLDEYFAECFRAYVEMNESGSPWPLATRERLLRHAPQMMRWFEREIGEAEEAVA